MASVPPVDSREVQSAPSAHAPLVNLLGLLNIAVAILAGSFLATLARRLFAASPPTPLADLVAENAIVRHWCLGLMTLAAVILCILMASGIGLLRRRRAAFKCSFYYPVVALAAVVLSSIMLLSHFGKVLKGPNPVRDGKFSIGMSAPSATNVTFAYTAVSGTAVAGEDFRPTSGTFTIPRGSTNATLNVPILGDSAQEGANETFSLLVSNVTHAILETPRVTATIWDNDSPPTLLVSDARVRERRHGAVDAEFEVSLSHAIRSNVTVAVRTEDITATAGPDYGALTQTLVIPAWRTNATIRVPVYGDTEVENGSETFAVVFEHARHAVVGTPRAIGTIVEDDGPPTMEAAHATTRERNRRDATAKFEIFLSHRSETAVTVDYETVDDTALAGTDYVAATGTLTIPRWRTNAFIHVIVPADTLIEDPEKHFGLRLSNASEAFMTPTNVVGTIRDDDAPPSLSVLETTVARWTGGLAEARVRVALSHVTADPVEVAYRTVDGTAIAGRDYIATNGTLRIPKKQREQIVTVLIPSPPLERMGDASFAIVLADATHARLATATGLVTIVEAPRLAITDLQVLEGKAVDDVETLAIRELVKSGCLLGALLLLAYPILMLVLISRQSVMSTFKYSLTDETYTVGTLLYTRIGLTTLFAWLLWGDFVFTIMEAVVPTVLPFKLKALGASNTLMSIILSTLPSVLNLTICPWVSFKSDRHRGRLGRRIPFIVWTMPFLTLTLIMLGWSEEIATWIRTVIPATQAIAPNTMAIAMIATFLVVFQFFNMFVNSVFWYLFNDVVPPQFLGRFMGLFRIAGTAASAIYNWYVFRYAETHMREILTGGALLYFAGFGLMCIFVKEGKYPPVTGEETYKRKGLLTDIRIFAKESFSVRFYWYFFLMGALSRVAYALGIFNIFFSRQMGLTLDQMGKLAAVGSIVGIVATYFTATLVDRWHPLRILTYQKLFTAVMGFTGWIWVMMTLPGDLFFWMSMAGTIIAAFDYVLTDAAGIPMMMRILPKSRYGQFSSANAMIRSLATIVAGLVAGGYMDFLMWMCDGSDYAYRWIWTWVWPFNILGTVMVVMGYQEWKRRGGDEHYRPPAPWSPEGHEEVIDKVKSSPGRPRAVIGALWLGWLCAILNIVLVLVFMVYMHRQDMMRSFWWHAQVFLPLKALLAFLIYWQIRSVRRDVVDLENGRTPKYGVPHHGVILVETATALVSFAVYWIQMSGMIRIGMERELIIFGVNTLISTLAHSLIATHILRVIERVQPVIPAVAEPRPAAAGVTS